MNNQEHAHKIATLHTGEPIELAIQAALDQRDAAIDALIDRQIQLNVEQIFVIKDLRAEVLEQETQIGRLEVEACRRMDEIRDLREEAEARLAQQEAEIDRLRKDCVSYAAKIERLTSRGIENMQREINDMHKALDSIRQIAESKA